MTPTIDSDLSNDTLDVAAPAEPWKPSRFQRLEAWLSKLSTKNRFWHKLFSLVWLPFAFRSGITLKRVGSGRFTAVLPFKRSNRNWYNAMAGAALLGNAEVAAGMFLFPHCGSDYIVVCKQMKYRFLRPCYGPAVYEVCNAPSAESTVLELLEHGGEFNIDLKMNIKQHLARKSKEVRVGRCDITFHCTPKQIVSQQAKRRHDRRA